MLTVSLETIIVPANALSDAQRHSQWDFENFLA